MLIVNDFFERSLFSFIMGIVILLISLSLYYPYYKGRKPKPAYGIEREKKIDYLKDGIRMLLYTRLKGFIYFGFFLLLLSLIFFILGLTR
jgi:hypothetical protein